MPVPSSFQVVFEAVERRTKSSVRAIQRLGRFPPSGIAPSLLGTSAATAPRQASSSPRAEWQEQFTQIGQFGSCKVLWSSVLSTGPKPDSNVLSSETPELVYIKPLPRTNAFLEPASSSETKVSETQLAARVPAWMSRPHASLPDSARPSFRMGLDSLTAISARY